ncbi:T9SS type A sorting domain-containing protein [Marinoscillum pacificum]|uniref:T9SS type A sorting domain-containing protein n=1 Tax=Marinoscillum pacificum TaxID=392723 RepID=UPI00215782C3|nr:T9SS type A sorting domain-containing protein [Marinoscillum pacificum]
MFRLLYISVLLTVITNLHGQCTYDDFFLNGYKQVGYKKGEKPIPYNNNNISGIINFDEGIHIIESPLSIRSGQVLRGAGQHKTILYFPNGLKGMHQPCGHSGGDCYDWQNAVIELTGIETGIEDLTILFNPHEWCHHCGEDNFGYNGIELDHCSNCWVKNVSIKNADNGLFIREGHYNTVDGLNVHANPNNSHLHIAVSRFSKYNLIINFNAFGSSFHGITANWGVDYCVFANGWGEDLYIEPDHNCNGVGGEVSCSSNILYSNISGKIRGIQSVDRLNKPLETILWNIGNKNCSPDDLYLSIISEPIKLYPNPCNLNYIKILSSLSFKNWKVKITNSIGQQIHLEPVTHDNVILLPELPPGLYIIELNNVGSETIKQKLIITH